jgi:hypothetical protein
MEDYRTDGDPSHGKEQARGQWSYLETNEAKDRRDGTQNDGEQQRSGFHEIKFLKGLGRSVMTHQHTALALLVRVQRAVAIY